jgi:hypothetical protein
MAAPLTETGANFKWSLGRAICPAQDQWLLRWLQRVMRHHKGPGPATRSSHGASPAFVPANQSPLPRSADAAFIAMAVMVTRP